MTEPIVYISGICFNCGGELKKTSWLNNFLGAGVQGAFYFIKAASYIKKRLVDEIESNSPILECKKCKHLVACCPYCRTNYGGTIFRTQIDLTLCYKYTSHAQYLGSSVVCPRCGKISVINPPDTLPKFI